MKVSIPVALVGAVVLIICVLVYQNVGPHMVLQWRLERIARHLATSLKDDSRYSHLSIVPIAKAGGYVECTGYVVDTNTFKALCEVFQKYPSKYPIRNHVYIVPEPAQNK
jgi:uncharacterized membrane protein